MSFVERHSIRLRLGNASFLQQGKVRQNAPSALTYPNGASRMGCLALLTF